MLQWYAEDVVLVFLKVPRQQYFFYVSSGTLLVYVMFLNMLRHETRNYEKIGDQVEFL